MSELRSTACPEAGVANCLPLGNPHGWCQTKTRGHTQECLPSQSRSGNANPSPETQGRSEAAWQSGSDQGGLTKARGTVRGDSVQAHVWSVLVVLWPCAQVRIHQTVHLKHASFTAGQLRLTKLLKTGSAGVDERYRAECKLGDSWKFIPYLDSDMMVR